MAERSALIVGAGDGTGMALARHFGAAGFAIGLLRRDAAGLQRLVELLRSDRVEAVGEPLDATREDETVRAFAELDRLLPPVELAIYNVALLVRGPVVELAAADYRRGLDIAYGAFLTAREAGRRMLTRGSGSILFTSSTASLRGAAGNAALASARFAVRALAQSMARELGPRGIHVAHIAIDGMIDSPALRAAVPDFETRFAADSLLRPADIAAACAQLHAQPRSAWAHELVLRPYCEKW